MLSILVLLLLYLSLSTQIIWSFSYRTWTYYNEKFTLTSICNRGLGLIANTRIRKGELLIREKPIISISTKKTSSWFKPSDSYSAALIDALYHNLTEKDQSAFRSLHNLYDNNNDLYSSFNLLGIFRTNAYPTTDRDSAGLFQTISRINRLITISIEINQNTIDYNIIT